MLAAVARKDYDDRRCRVAEGQAKAKEAGLCEGRPEDTTRNAGALAMGMSWYQIWARDRMQSRDHRRDRQARRMSLPAPAFT